MGCLLLSEHDGGVVPGSDTAAKMRPRTMAHERHLPRSAAGAPGADEDTEAQKGPVTCPRSHSMLSLLATFTCFHVKITKPAPALESSSWLCLLSDSPRVSRSPL